MRMKSRCPDRTLVRGALLIGSILLLSSQLLFAQTNSISLDRVVAIVDEDVVLESELNQRKASIMERLRGQYQQLPPDDVINKQLLEQLILERIQLSLAKRYEVVVEEADIDRAIESILQKNKLTLAQLEADLKRQGLNMDGLRKQLREQLLVENLQGGLVNNRIKISPQDIDNFLASSDGKYTTSPDYHIGHILIAVSSTADAETIAAAEKQANEVYEKLQTGSDFAQIAIRYSNDQAALQGGDIGWRKLAQLPELFGNQMINLPVGQVTKPFRSGAGFHLLKNLEQRGGGAKYVEQTHARHILVKTSEIMDDNQATQKLLNLKRRIEKGEDFAVLARENSEDPGSMLSGGDLGWSTPGSFVPEFEKAMAATPINGITSPFKSQFGWHILQVLERRQEDMSDKMKRNQAANVLRSRRFEEELRLWMSQIREEAYVEIKL